MKRILLLIVLVTASLVLVTEGTWGAQLTIRCVDPGGSGDYTDLQSALNFASANGYPDLIKVAQGTYTGNFQFNSGEDYSITLWGGYIPGTGCATRVIDPSTTTFDGSDAGIVFSIENTNGGRIIVDGFTLKNGNAIGSGGGLYARSSSSSGGGGSITVTNNIFTGNTTVHLGGGIFAESYGETGAGTITISNNTLLQNSAGWNGGGIYAKSHANTGSSGTITIQGNACIGNHAAEYSGGGISGWSFSDSGAAGDITAQENTCIGNTAEIHGGGIYVRSEGATGSGDVSVMKNSCTANVAHRHGGGIIAESRSTSGTAGAVLVSGNRASGNTASSAGGINAESFSATGTSGSVTLVNNVITGNTASSSRGGGVTAESYANPGGPTSAVTLTNNTITQNSAPFAGGAYVYSPENNVYVYNNIVWGNTADDMVAGASSAYGYNNNYSNFSSTWDFEANNLNADPKFVATGYWHDAGTPADPSDDAWVNGDYHLRGSSPCVNRGLNTAPEIPLVDFEGDERISRGRVDLGADESQFGKAMPQMLILLLD